MVFEKFQPPRKRADRPIVAITRKRLQLNSDCQKKYFKEKEFVELFYDRDKKIIGIKPLENETENSIKIRRYRERGIAVIAATFFIREFDLESHLAFDVNLPTEWQKERSIQVPADWDSKEKMVILKLQ